MATKRPPAGRPPARNPQRGRPGRSLSARTQRPWWQSPTALGGGALGIVVIVVIVVVLLAQGGANTGSSSSANGEVRTPVSSAVLTAVTQPDASELAQIATGGQSGNIGKLPATTTITDSSGKPVVMYVGAEYCPYCAAERWSLIAALARFGTFSGLQETQSSATDVFPNTNTFTFVNATYSSSWVSFQSSEIEDRNQQPLQSPSAQLASAFSTYDQPPYTPQKLGFPFLDIGGRYILSNTSFSPQILQGLTFTQIATQMADPSSQVAKAILGNANYITAAICSLTNNQPQTVCSAPYIQSIEATLPH